MNRRTLSPLQHLCEADIHSNGFYTKSGYKYIQNCNCEKLEDIIHMHIYMSESKTRWPPQGQKTLEHPTFLIEKEWQKKTHLSH